MSADLTSTVVLEPAAQAFAEATVPPTAGVAFSSWAWAKAWLATSAKAKDAGILIEKVRMG